MALFNNFSALQNFEGNTELSRMYDDQVNKANNPVMGQFATGYSPFNETFNFESSFNQFATTPVLYNMDGFVSPYQSSNFYATSDIIKNMDDGFRLPAAMDNRIDPNRIFNAEIAALNVVASDQTKTNKLFEKRLNELLSDKNFAGLSEEIIEAMQALTSGRTAVANINKEKTNIKKAIAEIRIKQQQQQSRANTISEGSQSESNISGLSNYDLGRTMLDRLGSLNRTDVQVSNYQESSVKDATDMIDDMFDGKSSDFQAVELEKLGAGPVVVVGKDDPNSTAHYEIADKNENILSGYSLPTSEITTVDRENHTAINNRNEQFPLIIQ